MLPTKPLSELTFLTFNLSQRDQIECKIFTELQLMGLQNTRSEVAKQLLDLEYDPLNPTDFGIQHSFLKGQITTLTWLIEAAEAAQRELFTLINNPNPQ